MNNSKLTLNASNAHNRMDNFNYLVLKIIGPKLSMLTSMLLILLHLYTELFYCCSQLSVYLILSPLCISICFVAPTY